MRAKLPHTTGYVDRDGVKLHYEIYGEGKHTIVFVPTWALIHSRCYKAQVPYFAEHFRVITFDPRGNGKSDRPDDYRDYALDTIIDDVGAVMDVTETEKATLFGFSFSSAISFGAAARMPERIEAVISSGAWTTIVDPLDYRKDIQSEDTSDEVKFSYGYWRKDYAGFCDWFMHRVHSEPHSTKQHEDAVRWASDGDAEILINTQETRVHQGVPITEETYAAVKCPCLLIHGSDDRVTPYQGSQRIAEITGGEFHLIPGGGHATHGRFPAMVNTLMRDFLAKHLGTYKPSRRKMNGARRALYLSSPIGLGHARRDLAVTRELRMLHPDLQVDWLAQDPVTRFLGANDESIHP
ncbi:alpha/beta fold hydrolase, partial [Boseongicola aestuarii]|uniref:alpha/beta fold hydrolase n=1 Tax=Boseongicola aestuarii TaxID=1470561 RepID=UPI00113231B6